MNKRIRALIILECFVVIGAVVGWSLGNQLLDTLGNLTIIVALLIANCFVFVPLILLRKDFENHLVEG